MESLVKQLDQWRDIMESGLVDIQIYDWKKTFIDEYYDKGYRVGLENQRGIFYPSHVGERTDDDLSDVEVKGEFIREGQQKRQKAAAYFRLFYQTRKGFAQELKKLIPE